MPSRYCLCSDPDYCLRFSDPDHRERAIAYRRAHDAPVPAGSQSDTAASCDPAGTPADHNVAET